MKIDEQVKQVLLRAMEDIEVELKDEFDSNFEQQAFFGEKWQRRRGAHGKGKTLLMDTGRLRRSVGSEIKEDRIIFTSTEPYAAIHNEGGVITVTRKMKGFFWYKYKQAIGGFGFTRSDGKRKDAQKRNLTTEAEFFLAMALKKEGSKIEIPRRRFLGAHPQVEGIVRGIIEEHLGEFFNQFKIEMK